MRGRELRFELADVGAQLVHGAAAAPTSFDLVAQISILLAVAISLRSWPISNSRSASRRPCSPSRASSSCTRRLEHLRFGRLRHELPFELGGACRELVELAAGLVQLVGRRLGVAALTREAVFGRPHGAFVIGDADLHRFDLGTHRRELDALTVGQDRALAEFGDEFGELRLLVGERALGFAQRARFELELVLGGAQLLAQVLVRAIPTTKIAVVFSPSSFLSWLMASLFLPSSASCDVVLVFICSTLISSRRVDMANSARN